eukprot:11294239-Alexandrium_andersonii.AAC.1
MWRTTRRSCTARTCRGTSSRASTTATPCRRGSRARQGPRRWIPATGGRGLQGPHRRGPCELDSPRLGPWCGLLRNVSGH